MFVMLITCLILSLTFLKLLKRKDQESSLSQARCLDADITTKAEMDNLKVDLSLYDRFDIDSAPVYENINE